MDSNVLEDFRGTIETAAVRLLSMSEKESEAARAEGKWSPKEVIGHLIDSAANNHQRFVRAQFKDDLVFPGYEQNEWVRAQRYKQESWPLLVQLWKAYNLHLLHVMASVPEEILKAERAQHSLDKIAWQTVSTDEPTTLEYLMTDYIGHLKNHLNQVLSAEY
ncbi:MAG: DinB family protein [Pyrinomonadaceae bacterium]